MYSFTMHFYFNLKVPSVTKKSDYIKCKSVIT